MSSEPLALYRALLRFGRGLQLTDRGYFCRRWPRPSLSNSCRIRFEFEKNRLLTDPGEVALQVAKGRELVRRGALV
jgi:hypothetical protein